MLELTAIACTLAAIVAAAEGRLIIAGAGALSVSSLLIAAYMLA